MARRASQITIGGPIAGAAAVNFKMVLCLSLMLVAMLQPVFGQLDNLSPARADSARNKIKGIANYVVYYDGSKPLKNLAARLMPYDLAILNTNGLTQQEISTLQSKGKLLVSYLSVGEVSEGSPLFQMAKKNGWILGTNAGWESHYVNVSVVEWQKQMSAAAGNILTKGYDGVFLDTVDTVDIDVKPSLKSKLKQGMISLIHRLRTDHPNMVIVQNRGFTVISETEKDIDAVMFEDLSTSYCFKKSDHCPQANTYKTFEPDEQTVDRMVELRQKMPVLALDYALPGDTKTACRAVKLARRYCFISAVSVGTLDDIPDYKLNECSGQLGP